MTFTINTCKVKIDNSIAINNFPSYLHPGGIRTQIVCPRGGCDDHCATPPGHLPIQIIEHYNSSWKLNKQKIQKIYF
jgi:hypothetical protein